MAANMAGVREQLQLREKPQPSFFSLESTIDRVEDVAGSKTLLERHVLARCRQSLRTAAVRGRDARERRQLLLQAWARSTALCACSMLQQVLTALATGGFEGRSLVLRDGVGFERKAEKSCSKHAVFPPSGFGRR